MRLGLFVSAAAIVLSAASPALADYVRIGSVDVRYQSATEQDFNRFGGPVAGLRFVAVNGNVFCNSIALSYSDGRSDVVTSYRQLENGRAIPVNVSDRARLDHVSFNCRANDRGAYIEIAADTGRYGPQNNDGWRRDRDSDSAWNKGPRRDDDGRPSGDRPDWNRGPDQPGPGGWMPLDRLSFEGSNDVENAFTGWRGRFIDRMALRSVNVTARCNRVIARYRDGDSVTLAKNRKLEQGETVILDLPGGRRPLDTIYLRCHAFGNGRAIIEVLGQR